jgi:hypothetical protein
MAFRLLMLGSPKSGKSGALACAANAGWTIRYLDFDGNSDPLIAYTDPAHRSNIQIVSCLDELKSQKSLDDRGNLKDITLGLSASSPPKAWRTMLDAMDVWPVDGSNPRDWDPHKNLFVVDSLTTAGQARMRSIRYLNGRRFGERNFRDYMLSQEEIESFLIALKVHIPCPVAVLAHIQTIGPDLDVELEDNIPKELRGKLQARLLEEKLKEAEKTPWTIGPVSVGKAQVKTLASHFSGAVLVEARPSSDSRVMVLRPKDGLNLGVPFPASGGKPMPRELPQESGMKVLLDAWVASQQGGGAQTVPPPVKK